MDGKDRTLEALEDSDPYRVRMLLDELSGSGVAFLATRNGTLRMTSGNVQDLDLVGLAHLAVLEKYPQILHTNFVGGRRLFLHAPLGREHFLCALLPDQDPNVALDRFVGARASIGEILSRYFRGPRVKSASLAGRSPAEIFARVVLNPADGDN